MMMTAIACREEGLVFAGFVLKNSISFFFLSCFYLDIIYYILLTAGVHDSFWTHACDVDVMNRVLREKFVKLYGAPVLENVLKFEYMHLI